MGEIKAKKEKWGEMEENINDKKENIDFVNLR